MHLMEEKTESKKVYQGKIFYITEDMAKVEDGTMVRRDVVHHSGGVCVVPLTEDNHVLLVRQFRYPNSVVTLEVPAGKLEPGEDPATCGRRELREETGRTCNSYRDLGLMYPTPAYDTEITYIYLAQDLSEEGAQDLDPEEFLDIVEMPLETAVEKVLAGEIPDAKTQVALLKTYILWKENRL